VVLVDVDPDRNSETAEAIRADGRSHSGRRRTLYHGHRRSGPAGRLAGAFASDR
jgi:hypothetical protein